MLIKDGDYVRDDKGGIKMLENREELLQRVLFRLTARRGAFPLMENLGSRLYTLSRLAPSARKSAACQYISEALSEEEISVSDVVLSEGEEGVFSLSAQLEYEGEEIQITLEV